jgi:hypothetical protein
MIAEESRTSIGFSGKDIIRPAGSLADVSVNKGSCVRAQGHYRKSFGVETMGTPGSCGDACCVANDTSSTG